MAGTIKVLAGPLALTTTLTTTIYNGAGGSAVIYDVVRLIHIVNKTTSPATFTIYKGLTGANTAGTEMWVAQTVPANTSWDYPCMLKLVAADFLVGGSATTLALVITIMGEQYVI